MEAAAAISLQLVRMAWICEFAGSLRGWELVNLQGRALALVFYIPERCDATKTCSNPRSSSWQWWNLEGMQVSEVVNKPKKWCRWNKAFTESFLFLLAQQTKQAVVLLRSEAFVLLCS